MRRQERQVTDPAQLNAIIAGCKICRVAMMDDLGLYIVPMNFGYLYEKETLTLYFHCAKEGRKVNAFRRYPKVAFEMDCNTALVAGNVPCAYSYNYQSIVGCGTIAAVTTHEEKSQALTAIMAHQTGKHFTFDKQAATSVAVYKIESTAFTGKQHISKPAHAELE